PVVESLPRAPVLGGLGLLPRFVHILQCDHAVADPRRDVPRRLLPAQHDGRAECERDEPGLEDFRHQLISLLRSVITAARVRRAARHALSQNTLLRPTGARAPQPRPWHLASWPFLPLLPPLVEAPRK